MNEVSLWYHPLLEALGYAIFHSLWQSVLLFFPLQVVLFFCKKSSLRYRILYGSFTALFLVFVTTFFMEWNDALSRPQQVISLADFININDVTKTDYDTATNLHNHWWQNIAGFYHNPGFRKMLPAISICYVLGIVLLGLRMLIAVRNLKSIRGNMIQASSPLQERFSSLVQLVSIKRKVSLYLSEHVNVPLMMGHLKPIVILPVALINRLDWQQTEAILLHELVHVKRMDYLFNILQSVMEVFLFFNPIVWWFSGIIRKEREHCCDDATVALTEQPVKYAEALLQLELSRKQLQPALAATGNHKKYTLLNRIKRIVEMKTTSRRSPQSILATLTFFLFFAALFCYYTTVAQEPKKDNSTKRQTQKTTYTNSTVTDTDGEPTEPNTNDGEIPVPPVPPEPPVPPNLDDIVGNAMNAANVAMANINWDDVNDAMKQAGKELSKIDWTQMNVDMADAQKDIADAQKDIADAQKEIADVNWAEVNNSIQTAQQTIKEIDWEEIGNNINTAMRSVKGLDKATMDKTMKDVQKAMAQAKLECKKAGLSSKVILDSLHTIRVQALSNLRSMRNNQVQQISVVRNQALNDAANAREDARKDAVNAKTQARNNSKTTGLLNKLEQDGLIDRSKEFSISYKNNSLMVNGKKVAASDYQSFLPAGNNASLSISGSKNNLTVSQQNATTTTSDD